MTDLLPCPFCGSANLRYEFAGSQGYICCDDCGTQGPCDEKAADPHCSIEAAKAAWNRRATDVPVPAGLLGLSRLYEPMIAWHEAEQLGGVV